MKPLRAPTQLVLSLVSASVILAAPTPLFAQSGDITVIWPGGRDEIPVTVFSGVETVSLDAVERFLDGTLKTGADPGVAFFDAGKTTARISSGGALVRLATGEVIVLSSPCTQRGNRWYVPLDFLGKILPAISAEEVLYREEGRLLIVGKGFPRVAVSVQPQPAYTRVVVESSAPVAFQIERAARQVRIEIPASYIETDFERELVQDGVVEEIALSRRGGGDGYVVTIDLGDRFGTLKAFEQGDTDRVILDLFRSRVPAEAVTSGIEPAEPAEPIPSEPGPDPDPGAASVPAPPPPPAPPRDIVPPGTETGLRIVTIDPGHGGGESGATGPGGLQEKDVTLGIARRLRQLLEDRLGVRVILTRDGDRELALDERTEIANSNKSDLFISIHANAAPASTARGSEVYFLSYDATDEEARRLAAVENRGGGTVARVDVSRDLEFILWDMAQAAHLNESANLAETLQTHLLNGSTDEKNRGIKQAPFRVLMGARMPAVLVEVGFITNPEEEKLLGSADYQNEIAEAIFEGLLQYKERYERKLGGARMTGRGAR